MRTNKYRVKEGLRVNEMSERILEEAIERHASDIFIFPIINGYEVKIRTAVGLNKIQELSRHGGRELLNYFKFQAQMDISERRRPQVGAYQTEFKRKKIFLRFSSVGEFAGDESLVVRLIYGEKNNNYFLPEQFNLLKKLTNQRGLIVTSGPTGSGKTSTMYELAQVIGRNKVVMTIEDPVEVWNPDFLQTQVNLIAGITYPDLLKAALRHRPDILIIGEIRDQETAKVSINAALSGHLVLATIHAKTAFQTISRLEGLGITKDELSNCLTAVSYQRLLPIKDKNDVACLMDIGYGEMLNQAIANNDKRGNLHDWQNNLNQLVKRGKISEKTQQLFEEG